MNFDDYVVTAEYPKPVSTTLCQHCRASVRKDDKFCSNCGVDLVALRAPLIEKYEELKYEYERESESKIDNFWIDTLSHYGFSEEDSVIIPIHRIKAIAWDRGHSAGLREVFDEFGDLVDEAVKVEK